MRGGCCLCVCGFCGFPVPVCWTGPSRMHVYSCVSVCVSVLVAAAERGSVKLFVQYESYSHCACVCASCLSVGVCLCDYLCSSACKNLFEATTSSSSLTFDCMFLCVCVCRWIQPSCVASCFDLCGARLCSDNKLQPLREAEPAAAPSLTPSSIFHPSSLSHSPAFMEAINNLTLSPCLTWF